MFSLANKVYISSEVKRVVGTYMYTCVVCVCYRDTLSGSSDVSMSLCSIELVHLHTRLSVMR